MAEDKKSFILYCDYINLVDGYEEDGEFIEGMTDEEAGMLFRTILRYVNDKEPKIPRQIYQAFSMIRNDLKEDLKKWKDIKEKRSEAGKIGMQKRWNNDNENITKITNITSVKSDKKEITNITDNVNVNDNVNVDVIYSDKSLEYNIGNEELQIEIIKSFMQQVEALFNGKISPKNRDIAIKMCETYGSKTALNEIKRNIDKNNPINYANTILQSQNKEKVIVRKSKWFDDWSKNFNKDKEDEE